jgi:glycine betaine/proline transport system substrate-binding protein
VIYAGISTFSKRGVNSKHPISLDSGIIGGKVNRQHNGRKETMKFKSFALTGALLTGLSAGVVQAQECGEVSITEMDWASAAVVTSVSKFLMEQGYGCTVIVVPSASTPALASVAETGEPDILTELWVSGTPAYDELEAAGKVEALTNVLSDGGVEGWWIPTYLVEAHPELATLEGVLANAELLGGRFHQCPEGWYCKTVNRNLITATGLADAGFEIFEHGSGETMATSIAAAFSSEEPWIGYYWAPTSVLGKYPMTMVDLGEFDAEAHACNTEDDCANPRVSPYPSSRVLTVVTAEFAAENPTITDLMRNVSFTNQQMGEILAWQEANNASAEEAAVYFLTSNTDIWGAWLNDSARENLSALLN